MNGPRATGATLAFALLLALSPVAALPTAGTLSPASDSTTPLTNATNTPPVAAENGTAARLIFSGDVETATTTMVALDVGGSVAIDDASVRGRYEQLRLLEAFDNAETTAQRRTVVSRTHERLDERIATLERRERQVLQRYNRGAISTGTYLRELAAIDAGADSLSPAVGQLYQYTQVIVGSSVSTADVSELKARLVGLNGPVRERVKRAMRGETSTERVYVSTSETGVVLSTIVGEEFDRQFVREVYLPDERAPGAPDQFFRDGEYRLSPDVQDRASELYPWAFDNQLSLSIAGTGAPFLYRAGVYSVAVDHSHGTARDGDLVTYIDGGTTEAFREVQYLSLDAIPTADPQTNRSSGLLVQVNRTYAGGPLETRVRDSETSDPVAATVRIDGDRIGETGPDGRLWTVTPRDPFLVNATTPEGASVDVRITFSSDQFGS